MNTFPISYFDPEPNSYQVKTEYSLFVKDKCKYPEGVLQGASG